MNSHLSCSRMNFKMSVIKFITSPLFGLCTTIDGCFFCPHRVTGAHTPSSQHRLRCQTLWLTSGPWLTRREYLLLSCCQNAAREIRCRNYCACFMLWKAILENTMHMVTCSKFYVHFLWQDCVYWDEDKKMFGDFEVELVSTDNSPTFITRNMLIRHVKVTPQ